jgi:iron(III) transport system permease protein
VDRGAWGAAIARVAAAVALGAIVGGPLLRLFVELDGAALGALLDPLELRAARNTVAVVAGTTTLSLTAGVALGVLLARTDLPHPERLRTWLVVPYVLPPYVTALGWLLLLNPATGWLYRGLDPYSLAGMIAVLAVEHTPLVLLATLDALGRMDGSLEEQARIAGAGPLGTLRRVTLPLVAPAILAAASFVASSSAAAFGVPYLLSTGASDPTFVLTTRIAQALDLDPAAGRPRAVALSLVLLAVGVVVPGLAGWWLRGRSTTTVRGKVVRPSVLPLGGLRWPAFAVVCAVIAATTALPLGAIALASVRPNLGSDGFTGTHYARLVTGPAAGVFARSAVTAAAAAAAAVGVGALVAWREVRAGDRALGAVARLPYAVPGTVLALGLLLAFSAPIRLIVLERVTFELHLADTAAFLALAWALKYLALPVGTVGAALRAIDPALEEAGRVAGAGPWAVGRRIVAPLLAPSLASAFALVFLPAFSEVTLATLLAGPRTPVVGTLLFERQTYGDPPGAAALAVGVVAVVLGVQALARRAGR